MGLAREEALPRCPPALRSSASLRRLLCCSLRRPAYTGKQSRHIVNGRALTLSDIKSATSLMMASMSSEFRTGPPSLPAVPATRGSSNTTSSAPSTTPAPSVTGAASFAGPMPTSFADVSDTQHQLNIIEHNSTRTPNYHVIFHL